MGLESGNFVADLVQTNPPTSDQETQGANHLQLIKKVLQQTFLNATKGWNLPQTVAKTANYTVVLNDNGKTFLADTSGGTFVFTLPTLASGDAGYEVFFLKTSSDSNAFFVAPASGTVQSGEISGLARARRCVPGRRTSAIWTGTAWLLQRAIPEPIGTLVPITGLAAKTLPVGYEWPNGQVLTSASTNYPEYFAKYGLGTTIDMRGRSGYCRDDIGGVAAGRLTTATAGNIDGTIPNNSGGLQTQTLALTHIPPITPTVNTFNLTANVSTSSNNIPLTGTLFNENQGAGSANNNVPKDAAIGNVSASGAVSGTITMNALGGGGLPHTILPPAIILDYVLVVE